MVCIIDAGIIGLSPWFARAQESTLQMTNMSLEEPRALVQQLVTKFLPENDIVSIQSVSANFNQLLTARQKKMAQSRETLQLWIKKVEAAKWEAQRPSEKSELKHIERISEVEKERFALVKQIEEFELSAQQFTSVLEQAVIQSSQLKEANEKSKKITISPIDLQLEIYRSLGIEWLNTVSENSKKCRIRSAINNDVHTVEVASDQNIFNVTNRLWDLCSI